MSDEKIVGVKGMNDLLPSQMPQWQQLERVAREVLAHYGYSEIRTPIVEPRALYVRGLGQVTDIVEKEMYAFTDRLNGDELCLRPEGTAGVVRAVIEHHLTYDGPQRLWYQGPMFRHERPQKGRYRQFHQIGVEALGLVGPDVDAELIFLCRRLWQALALPPLELQLNSIGDSAERSAHRIALVDYLQRYSAAWPTDLQQRITTNPLRVLDSKIESLQAILDAAPQLIDYLGTDSRAHFDGVQQLLQDQQIPYRINPRLVRGMDYYNRTVFEWVSPDLGAQGTVCGGGRYDPLTQMYGGPATAACGFALGIERVLSLMPQVDTPQLDVYLMHSGLECTPFALQVAEILRNHGVRTRVHHASAQGQGSFKSQFKKADQSGARWGVIIGATENEQQRITVKDLRVGTAQQLQLELSQLPQWCAQMHTIAAT